MHENRRTADGPRIREFSTRNLASYRNLKVVFKFSNHSQNAIIIVGGDVWPGINFYFASIFHTSSSNFLQSFSQVYTHYTVSYCTYSHFQVALLTNTKSDFSGLCSVKNFRVLMITRTDSGWHINYNAFLHRLHIFFLLFILQTHDNVRLFIIHKRWVWRTQSSHFQF